MSNNVDAFIPDLWAMESLAILEENMVVAQLVHRDFENVLSSYGDVVNTRKPGEFEGVRKDVNDNVTVQNATATNVPVPLDQHLHVSFLIRDGEESRSMTSLIETYMRPAMIAQARFVDQCLLGQYPQFLANNFGRLRTMTVSKAREYILGCREVLNVNKAPVAGRNLILTPSTETLLLNLDIFTSAERVGDDGTALREASLGRKLGLDIFMCQNMSTVAVGNTTTTGAINLAAGYPKGHSGPVTVDGFSAAISNGTWVSLDGVPYRVTASVGGSTPTSLTFERPLSRAVADDAVILTYTPGTVNNTDGYPAGYSKSITVSNFSVSPRVGQFVTFGTASNIYTIIKASTTSITLDRPLAAAIANNATVNIGPAGDYNLAFTRNSMALVVRPLATPVTGTGALSYVANDNGLSMRATITYDGDKQGHLVTLDMLFGVKVLDPLLGALLLA